MELPDLDGLVRGAQERDVRAFATLVRRFQNQIWSYAFALCRDSDEATDIAQEAFFEAFRRLTDVTRQRFLAPVLRLVKG